MSKELWFAEMERILNDKLDKGMDWDKAYEQASNEAGPALLDRFADIADRQKKIKRGE